MFLKIQLGLSKYWRHSKITSWRDKRNNSLSAKNKKCYYRHVVSNAWKKEDGLKNSMLGKIEDNMVENHDRTIEGNTVIVPKDRHRELSDLWNSNIPLIGGPENEDREAVAGLFNEIIPETPPNQKDRDLNIGEASRKSHEIQQIRPSPRHFIFHLTKYAHKEGILKAGRDLLSWPSQPSV